MNNRAQHTIEKLFGNSVEILDGFKITDRMCDLSAPYDGRHFANLRPMKLSLFLRRVASVLFLQNNSKSNQIKNNFENNINNNEDDEDNNNNDDENKQEASLKTSFWTMSIIFCLIAIYWYFKHY